MNQNQREIKFRLWNIDDKEWDVPNILEVWDDTGILQTMYSNRNYVIQEYIGLKDKNNKEIYEGDIVKISKGRIGDQICVIRYNPPEFQLLLGSDDELSIPMTVDWIFAQEIEILGNIFENGELLK